MQRPQILSSEPESHDARTAGSRHPASIPEPDSGLAAPRRRSRSHRFGWLLTTALALTAAVSAVLLSQAAPLHVLELKTYDLRFVLNSLLSEEQAAPGGIQLILIDTDTQAAIPEPQIFWHEHYSALLQAASQSGARAIGLDVAFTIPVEQWVPDFDRKLAATFAEVSATTPVVLAFDSLSPPVQNLPLYLFGKMQGAMGFTNLTLDADGFVRRQELMTRDTKDRPAGSGRDAEVETYESFAARLAAVSLNTEWRRPEPLQAGAPLLLGDRSVPADSDGAMRIRFWGPADTFPSVSMAKVLRAINSQDTAQLGQWFRGNVVLIGTADPTDQQSTPFSWTEDGQGLTPGVEIQASALATLLEGRFLEEPPVWVAMTLVLAAAALAAICIVWMPFPAGPLVLVGAVAAYLAVTVPALGAGMVLPVVMPLLAAVLSGLGNYGAQALTEGGQKRLLQEYFGRYVSEDMAKELLEYGEVPLGGHRQPVTVMFADLRDYTSYCQGRDAEQVVSELNEYFSDMSAEIKAHGGMINKFIGDGIMALFGAPLPHPDDARRAVACAVKMIERNEAFNRRRAGRGLKPLVIGIGIHTGEAVVGNIGAPEKMEYTAIGDAVNVAARIEGENKTFGTRMLISEATWLQIDGHVPAEQAGAAQMKGIDEPMTLYRVVGVE